MEERTYEDDYYEIDLREYIKLLWNKKWLIIGFSIIAVLLAGIYSFFVVDPVYESDISFIAPAFTLIDGQELTNQDYLSFIRNPDLEEKVLMDLELTKINPLINIEELDKSLQINRNESSNIISLKYQSTDPELSAKILNYWYKQFKIEVNNYLNEYNHNYLSNLGSYKTEQREAFNSAQKALVDFEKVVNLNLLKARLDSRENSLITLENRIDELNTLIKKKEAEYIEVVSQFEKTPQFITTTERVDEKWEELLELNNSESLTLERQELYSLYPELETTRNNLEQELTAHKTELESITNNAEKIDEEIALLQKNITEREETYNNIRQTYDITLNNYIEAEETYSEAQQLLNSRHYEISIVSYATIPGNPISPNKILNIAIAGILGFMLSIFIIFFSEFMKEEKEKEVVYPNRIKQTM